MMRHTLLYRAAAALGLCLLTPASGFVATPSSNGRVRILAMGQTEERPLSTRDRYKLDIEALDQLLDAQEEHKLEAIKSLVKDIQKTRKDNPEVTLSPKVRDALAEFHRAEAKYGHASREAQMAHEYFIGISNAENGKPEHMYDKDEHSTAVLEEALKAVSVLEELKEIAHLEKNILDRFGTTDFEVGEGFLERGIGKDDPDTYALWP